MRSNTPSVKLKSGGLLVLLPNPDQPTHYTVKAITRDGQVAPRDLAVANGVALEYEYGGPADGYPGYRLAGMIADVVGGEAILPPLGPTPPGVAY